MIIFSLKKLLRDYLIKKINCYFYSDFNFQEKKIFADFINSSYITLKYISTKVDNVLFIGEFSLGDFLICFDRFLDNNEFDSLNEQDIEFFEKNSCIK